ncbi:hypothetical protein [Nitrosomonas sp. Nm166]|uniref:hypothetical protein n=1 Tax=Nitrosomonas sp. Nm166 TaxID=1881054 RepID=UPI0008EA42DC|nr:hypothetical protein [Nitrosomonas sp. Nm166]SFE64068.1 site-specific DNA-methyltransferase (adenine-specific)/adenine-specific DNA-methyltransferase [Nitrosomonas sp. Nm166]
MKLTDHEKRDIIKRLEADKPLPNKYRFLLFEGKREVELVWNGKTHEACNIVLLFQTSKQMDEPRVKKPADSSLFDVGPMRPKDTGHLNQIILLELKDID